LKKLWHYEAEQITRQL